MKKEKNAKITNRGIISTLGIMLMILVITGAGGYTYARYATQEKGTGKAKIANWNFEIAKNGSATKTINLADTIKQSSLKNGKIAPGTSGEFGILLDATGSDVDVEYEVTFENEQNKPENLIFVFEGSRATSLKKIGTIKGKIEASKDAAKTKSIIVSWSWPYQSGATEESQKSNDQLDTQRGTSPLDYTFDIVAKGTQAQ